MRVHRVVPEGITQCCTLGNMATSNALAPRQRTAAVTNGAASVTLDPGVVTSGWWAVANVQWLAPPASGTATVSVGYADGVSIPWGTLSALGSFGPMPVPANQVVTITVTGCYGSTSVTALLTGYATDTLPDPPPVPVASGLTPPTGYTLVGTIAAGQATATVQPGPGTTAIVVTGVTGGTVTGTGTPSGITLPSGAVGSQQVLSLPAGPNDTGYIITLAASQATPAYIYQTVSQEIVITLAASSGGGGEGQLWEILWIRAFTTPAR